MQNKMSVAAPVKKIRKKSDCKPQSQIPFVHSSNKCNNEKRRRELENETIDQLEELLGACLSDVRQPDKNGIVKEAAAQIRRVLNKRRADAAGCCGECPPACVRSCSTSRVDSGADTDAASDSSRAGDVSSSQCPPDSEITALIEALKHYTNSLGWVLLEINSDGDIECVTENIKDLIRWERSELCKQSIYSYLHHGDHHKFIPILQNVSSITWSGSGESPPRKFQPIKSRLLSKAPDGSASEDGGLPEYAEVLISAAPVRGDVEGAASVMCVIRRCDDASTAALTLDGPAPLTNKQPHQITFKLDNNGIIITCDLSGAINILSLGPGVAVSLARSLEGRLLTELCAASDAPRLNSHLREAPAPPAPPAIAAPLRFRFAPNLPWLAIRSHSRAFRPNPITGEDNFIMSTHAILEDDRSATEPPPGGPLLNGSARNGQYRSDSPSTDPPSFSFGQDLDLEYQSAWMDCDAPTRSPASSGFGPFPYSPLPLDENKDFKESIPTTPGSTISGSVSGVASNERPHTPRTPHTPHTPLSQTSSAPSSVTAPPPAPSPDANKLRSLLQSKRPGSPAVSVSASPSIPISVPDQPSSANLILKGLLHQKDEEQSSTTVPASAPSVLTSQSHHPQHQQHKPHANNMLLAQLLQEKSDDDDGESRSSNPNQRSRSELLTQLLKTEPNSNGGDTNSNASSQDHSEELFNMLGIAGQQRKRKLEESAGPMSAGKRTPNSETQVTSTATLPSSTTSAISSTGQPLANSNPAGKHRQSTLLEKNRLLASLLERRPSAPTTPLPSPNPVLKRPFHETSQRTAAVPSSRTSHPNITLTHMLHNNNKTSMNNSAYDSQQQQQHRQQQQQQVLSHLQQMLQAGGAGGNILRGGAYSPQAQQQAQLRSSHNASRGPPTPATSQSGGGSPITNAHYVAVSTLQHHHHDIRTQDIRCGDPTGDRLLSDILEEVMDLIVPEPAAYPSGGPGTPGTGPNSPAPDQMINLMGNVEMPGVASVRQPSPAYQGMNEKMAINAIQKVLMQCESAVSPVSPGGPPAYPTPNTQLYNSGGGTMAETTRQHVLAAQRADRARLLHAQRGQQLLVPHAAEQQPTDIHSTIDALLSASTPPNVTLQRAPPPHLSAAQHHRHHQQQQQTQVHHQQHYHHPVATSVSNVYGNNGKLTPQQQQNPMLSAQLTGGYVNAGSMASGGAGGGGAGSPQAGLAPLHPPLASHAPMTAQHAPPSPLYHQRPPPQQHTPRPHPGGYYGVGSGGGGGGGGGDGSPFAPAYDRPLYPHHHHLSGAVSGSSASEYVRQELRAVVGARTGNLHSVSSMPGTPTGPLTPGGGLHLPPGVPRPTDPGLVSPADLDALGLSYEMPTGGGGGSTGTPQGGTARGRPAPQGSWEAMQTPPPSTTEEGGGDVALSSSPAPLAPPGHQTTNKSSLLQKLLSE